MPLAFARSVLTGGSSKSFTLTRSASNVNEGSSVTFTLNSSGMNGESVPYTITGITDSDISSGSLSGNILINSDETGSASVTTRADWHTEGAENLTFTIGSGYQQYADSNGYTTSVTVNDTSLTPRVDSITRSSSSVNEGSYVDLTFNTSNCRTNAGTAGTRIYFKITGIQSADISSVGGTASSPQYGPPPVNASTMTTEYGYVVTNGTSSPYIRLNMTEDLLTEGAQTLTCTVTRLYDYTGDGDGTVNVDGSTSQTVTINDTSLSHATGQIMLVPATSATRSGNSYDNTYGGSAYSPNYTYNINNQNTNAFSNFNWTVPSSVSDIAVAVVGAGGAGPFGSQNAYSGGGGGGGGLAASTFVGLTSGQSYTITVGKAGNTGKASGYSQFISSNSRQKVRANAGRSPGTTNNQSANLGGFAQSSDSQSNTFTGRAGGNYTFGNSFDSGVTVGNQYQYSRHQGIGGSGGRGYYFNSSNAGGGGGGAGGWGRANAGQTGTGGQGGRAFNVAGTAGQGNGAGGGGGSGGYTGGQGGGVGMGGPGSAGNGGSGSNNSTGGNGNAGAAWQGYEYGYGGGGGSSNQAGVRGGCGAVRIIYTSGAKWE